MSLLDAGAAAKGAISMLAMMCVQGTVLALLALVLVRAGKLRPAWSAAIWLVVMVKFVLPWGPAMPWSLSDLIAYLRHDDVGHSLAMVPTVVEPIATASSVAPAIGWLVLAAVWATGTAVVLARTLAAQRIAVRDARLAAPASTSAQSLLATLAASLRVRTPRLVVGDDVTGPYVVGLVRAIIVVPPALLEDETLLRAALLHELAHVRRRDAIGRCIQMLATAVFFFWPIVRIAGRRLDLAREAACDAWALEAGDVPRPAYARLLVRMAALRTAAAAGLASPRSLDARVAAVLGPPVRARMSLVHKVALLGWTLVALGGARTAAARGEADVCKYTPQIAETLRQAHPEADLDGDGYLSKHEACELQAEVRRRAEADGTEQASSMVGEPLCCNCDSGDGLIPSPERPDTSCQRSEGVD
ncbi:MAG: M56 family metallopeptidase [Deltaproteobacteria bacterium]|nr:M56 family metallopeptidase [Deltaproteobacteria bacterium]